jgi:hypothetical protein
MCSTIQRDRRHVQFRPGDGRLGWERKTDKAGLEFILRAAAGANNRAGEKLALLENR